MSDYKRVKGEIDAIIGDLGTESDAEKVRRIAGALIDKCSREASAEPDEMEIILLAHLLDSPGQYPSLLSVNDGNEKRAAKAVVEFMVWVATNRNPKVRHNMTPIEALREVESIATAWVNR